MEEKFELLQNVMNTIDIGLVFVDDANQLVFFNRAAGEFLNMEPEERIGTSVSLCHPMKIEQMVEERIDQFRKDPQLKTKGRIAYFLNESSRVMMV